jgi:hypothetical protein
MAAPVESEFAVTSSPTPVVKPVPLICTNPPVAVVAELSVKDPRAPVDKLLLVLVMLSPMPVVKALAEILSTLFVVAELLVRFSKVLAVLLLVKLTVLFRVSTPTSTAPDELATWSAVVELEVDSRVNGLLMAPLSCIEPSWYGVGTTLPVDVSWNASM